MRGDDGVPTLGRRSAAVLSEVAQAVHHRLLSRRWGDVERCATDLDDLAARVEVGLEGALEQVELLRIHRGQTRIDGDIASAQPAEDGQDRERREEDEM